MDRRAKICVTIILIGLANFLAYSILYAYFYGEAVNGVIKVVDGQERYFLQSGREVGRWVFLYSGVHSISIWPTVAAIMLAMLTIAKDRILGSTKTSIAQGRAMITLVAVVIAVVCCIMTFVFTHNFISRMKSPVKVSPGQPADLPWLVHRAGGDAQRGAGTR